MTTMTLPELAKLLEAATFKLPLRVEGHHEYDGGAYGDPPGIDAIEDAEGKQVVVADSGVCPPTKPDADLIVALVNAAPRLLALASAAVAWREASRAWEAAEAANPGAACREVLLAAKAWDDADEALKAVADKMLDALGAEA